MQRAWILLLTILFAIHAFGQLDPRERYGTYLGGSVNHAYDWDPSDGCYPDCYRPASSAAEKVLIDSTGNIYVAGATNAIDFPVTSAAYRKTVFFASGHYGPYSDDSFVAKFSPSGALIWSTYLGLALATNVGGGINALGLDSNGNVVIVGGSYLYRCGTYPFIVKLNGSGTAVSYSNVFDACSFGAPTGAAIDATGRFIYLAGVGSGLVKVDTFQSSNFGIVYDVPVTSPTAVTSDAAGNVYVLSSDTRVSKFDALGRVLYSVNYLSSLARDSNATSIILTSSGDVMFTGQAPQGEYPVTTSFGNLTYGAMDTLIVRLTGSTGNLTYSAVLHDANMIPIALARNSANEAFVTGRLTASSYRVSGYSGAPLTGAFLLRLNSTGSKLWLDSTFGGDVGYGVAVDKAWNAYVVGTSNSGEYFPITSSAYQSSFKNAASQSFLAKLIIEADAKMLIQGASPNPVTHGTNLTYTLSVYNNGPDVSDGDTITDVLPTGTTFVSFSTTNGTCTHPAVGYGGTFKCSRTGVLNKGSYWGPVKMTVKVNAAAGTTIKNTASVAAKTQDVVPGNNTATVYVKVQ